MLLLLVGIVRSVRVLALAVLTILAIHLVAIVVIIRARKVVILGRIAAITVIITVGVLLKSVCVV